jgi:hypothetical protein
MLVNCCPKLIGGTVYFGQVDSGIESDKELLFGKTLESKHALWYKVSILMSIGQVSLHLFYTRGLKFEKVAIIKLIRYVG